MNNISRPVAVITVDKGVPMKTPKTIFPWKKMSVGDSFFAGGYVAGVPSPKPGMKRLTTNHGKLGIPGSKWSLRTVTENGILGVRVWRTA